MRSLVRRYITNEQRTAERQRGVTEDDCNEIKQDISALRFELLALLEREGNESKVNVGKRGRKKERRLMKGFDFNFLFMDPTTSFDEDLEEANRSTDPGAVNKVKTQGTNKFARIARGLAGKRGSRGNKWKQLIEATRSKVIPFSRSSESVNSLGQRVGSGTRPSLAASEQATGGTSPDGRFDANVKRSIFARKITSLLQEESQSQDVESDNEAPAKEMTPSLVVTLPVPSKEVTTETTSLSGSRNASRSPSAGEGTGQRASKRTSSPSRSPKANESSVNAVIGLTHGRSRNEWI